jgi:hypothetical protein
MIKLKLVYDNETDIPAEAKPLYEQRDGKWLLSLEDSVVPKLRLDEMRNTNTTLKGERDRFKLVSDKLEESGISLEDVVRLKGIEEDLKAEKLFKKGEIDKIVGEKLQATVKTGEKEKAKLTELITQLTRELEVMRIDEAAVAVALKHGLEDSAVEDVKARARATFKLVDGKPKALAPDGFEIQGDDGHGLSFEGWVQRLKPNAPHLFKRSTGGGGAPGKGSSRTPIDESKNPWKPGADFNLTDQGRIYKESPEKAQRLMAAAGVRR